VTCGGLAHSVSTVSSARCISARRVPSEEPDTVLAAHGRGGRRSEHTQSRRRHGRIQAADDLMQSYRLSNYVRARWC
jgi:hypothetical protein